VWPVSVDSEGVAGDFGGLQVLWNPHLRGGVGSVDYKGVGRAGERKLRTRLRRMRRTKVGRREDAKVRKCGL
jgi:hypothetical protein